MVLGHREEVLGHQGEGLGCWDVVFEVLGGGFGTPRVGLGMPGSGFGALGRDFGVVRGFVVLN